MEDCGMNTRGIGTWRTWMAGSGTYQVTGLGTSTSKDQDGFGACTGASSFKLVLGTAGELASHESLKLIVVGLCERDWGGGSQSSKKGGSEELHGEL
jgi:hypothetical protein